MYKANYRKLGRASVVGLALILLSGVFGFAQDEEPVSKKTKPIHIQATAMGTSTQLGRVVSIDIIVNEFSTAADQKGLITAFEERGNEGLYHAVDKLGSKGRIRITGTLGYDLNYIRELPQPDGSRKIRFVTDRPILFGEAWGSTRSRDYSISAGEVILSKEKGKSSGALLPACQLKLDKEKHLEIEAFQNPWKLENIVLR